MSEERDWVTEPKDKVMNPEFDLDAGVPLRIQRAIEAYHDTLTRAKGDLS